MKFKSKAEMMWNVSREAEENFINDFPESMSDIQDLRDLFKMIRGTEYRRGKEDGRIEMEKELTENTSRGSIE